MFPTLIGVMLLEFGRSGRELYGERPHCPDSRLVSDLLLGDVNLENRLQKAARKIPQPQQMRAYSTKSRPSNALRDSRHTQRKPTVSSTRSYATQTTNPNPPFGNTSTSTPGHSFFLTNAMAGSKNSSNQTPSKVALIGMCKVPEDSRPLLNMIRRQRLHWPRYGIFSCDRSCNCRRQTCSKCVTFFLLSVLPNKAKRLNLQPGHRGADCGLTISFDQSSQCSPTHGFAPCKRSA